ncbi:MAG: protein mobD [Gammaproteobacteria bacterium]|nr:protein mobD [Gammaproteobacteria bacterium]MCP5460098.1 protein mobD [Gammaproteobacteria bacterium]
MLKPIFLIGGSKGGVGKSLVAMALLDDLSQRGEPTLLIETDTSNPDVWRIYQAHPHVVSETLDLDKADGWIMLVNICTEHPERTVVINTAARNNRGASAYGVMLNSALQELQRRLVTLWVINRQRDSLELLQAYLAALPGSVTHVIRNGYFGPTEKFELYNGSQIRVEIQARAGHSLTFPELADRVSDDLYTQRLSITDGMRPECLPLGNRIELERWRHAVRDMFAVIVPAEYPASKHTTVAA